MKIENNKVLAFSNEGAFITEALIAITDEQIEEARSRYNEVGLVIAWRPVDTLR